MKAKLMPLEGKYYGTIIKIDFEDGWDGDSFKLWDSGDFTPSTRELERNGYTEKDFEEEAEGVYDITSDGHFESKLTYERAIKLVEILNTK